MYKINLLNESQSNKAMKTTPSPKKLYFWKNKGESWKIHSAAETMFFPYSELQWKTKTADLGAKEEVGPVVQHGAVHDCNELFTLEHCF